MADLSFFIRALHKTYFSRCTASDIIDINSTISHLNKKFIPKLKNYLSLFLILFFIQSCQHQPTAPGNQPKISIASIEVSCTEAWLQLKTQNVELPISVLIYEHSSLIDSVDLTSTETNVCIDSLLPFADYYFSCSFTYKGKTYTSENSSIKTMDSTTHNYSWQSWKFGSIGSSTLYDVAIIDENNIWAVGEINIADSSANGYTTHNAVHWNGNQWELKKITVNFRGYSITSRLEAIYAFSSTDIWVVGSLPIHGNGENWQIYDLRTTLDPNISVSKAWGINSDNIYFVGANGSIAWKNGSQWRKIETGTNLEIYDIWGAYNKHQNSYEIIFIEAEHLIGPRRRIFKIKDNSVEELSTSGIPDGSLHGIWFKSAEKYYVVGNGIYSKNDITGLQNWTPLHSGLSPYYIYGMSGTELNDIFLCGSYGESLHFNGVTWKSFKDTPGFYNAEFLNTKTSGDINATVGYSGSRAFIAIGKR